MNQDSSPQEHFKSVLLTVVGQAYAAAGYALIDRPVQEAAGQFTFARSLEGGLNGYIMYQLLTYVDTEWAARMPSRFRVTLTRTDQTQVNAKSDHVKYAQRDLGTLVVEDFGVAILSGGNYWWAFDGVEALGKALAEAGHLVIGYGIPWLQGDLFPPPSDEA